MTHALDSISHRNSCEEMLLHLSLCSKTTQKKIWNKAIPYRLHSLNYTPSSQVLPPKSLQNVKVSSHIKQGRTYQDALKELDKLTFYRSFDRKPGNDRTVFLEYLRRIGYTIDELNTRNVIHIAGTKGKGSTCAFVESIMKRTLLKTPSNARTLNTGMFTSPHLVSPVERIKINGKSISYDSFASLFFNVWDKLTDERWKYDSPMMDIPQIPSYFYYCFLMAIHKFIQADIDVVIIEAGIGGRFDLTNVIKKPLVCAVTLIGHDHENILGFSLNEIAYQKAGIFKQGCHALTTSAQKPNVLEVIEKYAKESNVLTYDVVHPELCAGMELGIKGSHQYQNAALAVEVTKKWCKSFNFINGPTISAEITPEAIKEGIRCTCWAGRSQVLQHNELNNLTFFLDGAHNIESMEACITWFSEILSSSKNTTNILTKKCLIFNLTGKRNFLRVAKALLEYNNSHPFDYVVFSTNDVYDSGDTTLQEEMAQTWNSFTHNPPNSIIKVESSISTAISLVSKIARENPSHQISVLITGSIYLVGGSLEVLCANVD